MSRYIVEIKEQAQNDLKGGGGTLWSRRISRKHRLVYEIAETVVRVIVLSAYGHYGDK